MMTESSFAQEIADASQQLPDAVVLSGINNRIQQGQIDVKYIPAYKPLIHLDVPDTAEKSRGITGFQRLLHFAFIYPSAIVQDRHVKNFTAAEGLGDAVLFPVSGMARTKVIH